MCFATVISMTDTIFYFELLETIKSTLQKVQTVFVCKRNFESAPDDNACNAPTDYRESTETYFTSKSAAVKY